MNIPPFVRLFSTISEIFNKNLIFHIDFSHPTSVLLHLPCRSCTIVGKMSDFSKDNSIRKTLTPLRHCYHTIGCHNKLFSVDIPSGVHIPSGVPTPVVRLSTLTLHFSGEGPTTSYKNKIGKPVSYQNSLKPYSIKQK